MSRARQPGDPLTPAVLHVLLALSDGPSHGYAVMKTAQASAGTSRRLGPGTIYGTLARLEEDGLIREAAPFEGRKTFELLPAGIETLRVEVRRLDRLAALAKGKRLLSRES